MLYRTHSFLTREGGGRAFLAEGRTHTGTSPLSGGWELPVTLGEGRVMGEEERSSSGEPFPIFPVGT